MEVLLQLATTLSAARLRNVVSGRSLVNDGSELSGYWTRPDLLVCGGAPRRNRTGDPILPWTMRQGFTPPRDTSRGHRTAQVKGAAEDRLVGRCEGTCSAVSGKSLACQRIRALC